jgi:hypothetical protein
MTNPIKAWHFIRDDSTIKTSSMKRPLKVHQGQILRHRGPLELCRKGLHASIKPLDALEYAPGTMICRVECSGDVIYGEDKLVCSRRKVLWAKDASRPLHEFAIWCASRALEKIGDPDPRSLRAVEVKKLWLDGEATNEELDDAGHAARCAAWDSARDAAQKAAWHAAWRAASEAAKDAAWAAAWWAARFAAWETQNEELERRLLALHPHLNQVPNLFRTFSHEES